MWNSRKFVNENAKGVTSFLVHLLISLNKFHLLSSQEAITCSKLTIETLEQAVKYVQS